MIGNIYKYALIDLSFILYRNCFAASRGNELSFTKGDVLRITIQTLNKLYRDFNITADKIILIYDKWDPTYNGYYTTYLLKGAYKDSRGDIEGEKGKANPLETYMTREKYEKIKADPTISESDKKIAQEKYYFNDVKQQTKQTMIREFGKLGMPCLGLYGYEFDNLAYIASMMLYSIDDKPSVIITKDSDLTYSLSPKMNYFKIPTYGSEPLTITYDDMYNSMPDVIKSSGLSLYNYKAYLDALGEGHNGMRKTKKDRASATEAISNILRGDYSDVDDLELFKLQYETFNVTAYPRFSEAKDIVTKLFSTTGHVGTLDEFHSFCERNGVNGISDKYFSDFMNRLDKDLYKD